MNTRATLFRCIPVVIGFVAIVLWLGWAWYVIARFPDGTKFSVEAQQAAAVRGQFGDMFGGINALFTALILAGAIYTVWLQNKELEALKQQQDDSKKENARTALLLAHTALINAKSSLLSARYQLIRDLKPLLETADRHSELSAMLPMMIQANAEQASKAMTDLETSATELSALVGEIRKQTPNNVA